jgi:phospholipid/cholesterol/gamma-HCH transport system substrate-binding protein
MKSISDSKKDVIKALLTIILGVALLGGFIIALGGFNFWEEHHTFTVRFRTVRDLSPGSPVKYAGLRAGRVQSIAVDEKDPGFIRVLLGIRSDFPLFEGTRAFIAQKGLVGDNYVYLSLEGESGARLQPGSDIPSGETPGIQEVASRIGASFEDMLPKVEALLDRAGSLFNEENTDNVRAILQEGPLLLSESRTALAGIAENFEALSEGTREELSQTLGSVNTTVQKMNTSLDTLNTVLLEAGASWTLTMAEARTSMNGTSSAFITLSEDVGEGIDLELEKLDHVLSQISLVLTEMEQLSRSLRERPWRLIRVPQGEDE